MCGWMSGRVGGWLTGRVCDWITGHVYWWMKAGRVWVDVWTVDESGSTVSGSGGRGGRQGAGKTSS